MKKEIYADHAATTQLRSEALEVMMPFLKSNFRNASALYSKARDPRKQKENSRKIIADIIGARSKEIVFTSGGSESDNWAIKSIAFKYIGQKKRIITSCIEHHAVLHSMEFLEKLGLEVIYLPVEADGTLLPKTLKNSLNVDTVLVSIIFANNEIGTIQDIKELARITHEYNAVFHTDAVQAVGHIPVDICELNIDLLSASAHKFGGPKGIGFLYVNENAKLMPYIDGGDQEHGMRAGTENIAGIVGMAKALEVSIDTIGHDMAYLNDLSKYLISGLHEKKFDFLVNGAINKIPGNNSLSFKDIEGEMLLHRLDMMGIEVSTGSACDSRRTDISHVLKAINIDSKYANGTIRISLGMDNSKDDIDTIIAALNKIIMHK